MFEALLMRPIFFVGLIAVSGCSTPDNLPRPVYPPTSVGEVEVVDSIGAGAMLLGTLDAYACAGSLLARIEIDEDDEGNITVPDTYGLQAEALRELKNKAAAMGATSLRRLEYQDVGTFSHCRGRVGVRASAIAYRNKILIVGRG